MMGAQGRRGVGALLIFMGPRERGSSACLPPVSPLLPTSGSIQHREGPCKCPVAVPALEPQVLSTPHGKLALGPWRVHSRGVVPPGRMLPARLLLFLVPRACSPWRSAGRGCSVSRMNEGHVAARDAFPSPAMAGQLSLNLEALERC